ncbi:SPOR domain-containing protein [Legionella sp.]|uniref:SPOR domain-containing protein n=1 Tax=Legionella sp. TaxID=459 RepID=UPI003C89BBFA
MKLVMNEKLKHRLVGFLVILSLGVIFLPAMMKKSSHHLESNFSVKVQLPPKPIPPQVAIIDEERMFKNIKVARADIPQASEIKVQSNSIKENTVAFVSKPMVANVASKSTVKREIYAVQLASFSQLENARALINKLQKKGYKANYTCVNNRKGAVYKVYVGHSPIKDNVVKLKNQLASVMQLNGFVVNTGVS